MSEGPDWLAPLDHTADAGFVVTAAGLPELFERAAWGMFDLICEIESVRPDVSEEVVVEAPDLAALMVKWLSELNFRHVTRHVLFRQFEVAGLGDHRLEARVRGEAIDPRRHTIHTEIKAVTYHGLAVERVGELWKARVIFDL